MFIFKVSHETPLPDEEGTCKITWNLKLNLKISGAVNRPEKVKPHKSEEKHLKKNNLAGESLLGGGKQPKMPKQGTERKKKQQ